MDIVIIAQYMTNINDLKSSNSRFWYLAKMLKVQGEKVEIVTSDFNHGSKCFFSPLSNLDGVEITLCHESGYNKNIGLKRIISHSKLAKSISRYLNDRDKPDVVYTAVPSLSVAKIAASYCKRKNVRFMVDVQDLWPEAYRMVFNMPVISTILFAPMEHQANYIYAAADEIVAVSQTYADRALRVNRKCQVAHSVFLGTDLAEFDRFKNENRVEKSENEIWIAYVGTLGASYDLTSVIEALKILKNKSVTNIRFVVMGDGPRKAEFEALADRYEINSEFTGRLPYPQMVGFLCSCDIAVNPITKGAAQSIINKVGDYAAAGLPVVNTLESPEYRNLIEAYNCGINCENSSVSQLAEALSKLADNVEMRNKMGDKNRRLAEDLFDRSVSYSALADLILKRSTT